jgi:hypothetical protein
MSVLCTRGFQCHTSITLQQYPWLWLKLLSVRQSHGHASAGGSWSGDDCPRQQRDRRTRAAQDGVLRPELPGGGADGRRLRPAARPPRSHHRRRAAPTALPRVLRQGAFAFIYRRAAFRRCAD